MLGLVFTSAFALQMYVSEQTVDAPGELGWTPLLTGVAGLSTLARKRSGIT